jgi:hypothetical protein
VNWFALGVLVVVLSIPAVLVALQYRQRCACGRFRLGFREVLHEGAGGYEYVHCRGLCDQPDYGRGLR